MSIPVAEAVSRCVPEPRQQLLRLAHQACCGPTISVGGTHQLTEAVSCSSTQLSLPLACCPVPFETRLQAEQSGAHQVPSQREGPTWKSMAKTYPTCLLVLVIFPIFADSPAHEHTAGLRTKSSAVAGAIKRRTQLQHDEDVRFNDPLNAGMSRGPMALLINYWAVQLHSQLGVMHAWWWLIIIVLNFDQWHLQVAAAGDQLGGVQVRPPRRSVISAAQCEIF